ncbi:MAG: glycosyltransferase [Candidatus Omnitrophota bacterium]|jgi:glycosyltransferase involved in cell wall biosynthesis|nr:MAG: glycosyltransferase [Candidatus Omnitrophota bacterium]
MPKKRILLIINSLGLGGIEKRAYTSLLHFNKDKYEFKVCCLFEKGFFAVELEKMGIPVLLIGANLYKRIDVISLLKLARIIKEYNPNIVRTYSIYANRYGNLAAKIAGKGKVVASFHGIYIYPKSRMAFWFDSFCLLFCTKLIVSSERMKEYCKKQFYINKRKISIIHNSVDLKSIPVFLDEQRLEIRNKLGIKHNELVLIAIGRLDKAKGFDILIKSFSMAKQTMNNLKLIIVGDGDLLNSLKDLAKDKAVANDVVFAGAITNIYEFLSIADLYVLSSLWEGFATVLLEAMSMKLPVVATDVGISKWLLTGNGFKCGSLVPPNDANALSAMIINLLNDPTKRNSMGINGRVVVENNFTIEKEIRRLEMIFDQI